tara:strand:+ start:1076 stop:1213 length:138 start_codon:yes stop_codon:yes gene_type:complete
MPAPWIVVKEKPIVEKAEAKAAPKATTPKKARKKTSSTTTKSSDK